MELALVALAVVMLAGQKPPPPSSPPAPKVPVQDPGGDYLAACLKGASAGAAVGSAIPAVGTGIGAAGGCAVFAGKEWLDENWDDVKDWWRDLWD